MCIRVCVSLWLCVCVCVYVCSVQAVLGCMYTSVYVLGWVFVCACVRVRVFLGDSLRMSV